MRIILDLDKELDGISPSELFAVTFAEAKFNSIVERGGTYSTLLKAARTGNNDIIFGYATDSREKSARPYTQFTCRIEQDGIPFFRGVAVLEEAQDFYGLRIYSGTAAFFDAHGSTPIQELDLSALNHNWTEANVYAARNALTNYCYPAINYGRWSGAISSRAHTDFFPAVYTKALLEAAATLAGYSVADADDTYALPFSKQDFALGLSARMKVECSADFTQLSPSGTLELLPVQQNFGIVVSDPTSHAYDYSGAFSTSYGYSVKEGGLYDFKAVISYDTNTTTFAALYIALFDKTSGNMITVFTAPYRLPITGAGTVELFAFGVQGVTNAYAQAGVYSSNGNIGTLQILDGSTFECTKAKEPIANGDTIALADTLPSLTVKDLFLFEVVRRNAYVLTDPIAKEIRFVPLDDIAQRAPAAVDWTDKVDLSIKPKYTYRLPDYARLNSLEWAEGVEQDYAYLTNPDVGAYDFAIDDQGLPQRKTAYKSKFAFSSVQGSFTDYAHLLIPRYSATSLTYDEPDIDPKPRAVKLVGTEDMAVQIGSSTPTGEVRYGQPETWEQLYRDNYISFSEIMNRFKQVEVYVTLGATDILNLDFTLPVRLLGNLWIIREVKQWKANRAGSTLIKLIRI